MVEKIYFKVEIETEPEMVWLLFEQEKEARDFVEKFNELLETKFKEFITLNPMKNVCVSSNVIYFKTPRENFQSISIRRENGEE